MSNDSNPGPLGRGDSTLQAAHSLFRKKASRIGHRRVFGEPSIAVPPSSTVAVGFAVVIVSLLGLAAWLVEVPQVVKSVGVIMPGDGLTPVTAAAQGRVSAVLIKERQRVRKGEVLLRLSADTNAAGSAPLAGLHLQSLEKELALAHRQTERRAEASQRMIQLTESRMAVLERQSGELSGEVQLSESILQLARRRVDRNRQLRGSGGVAQDQLDDSAMAALQAEIALRQLQGRIAQLTSSKVALISDRAAEQEAMDLRQIDYAVNAEQLQRQIQVLRMTINREIVAPHDGVVSRVQVVAGETVQPGRPLLVLQTGSADLVAWLYVATRVGGKVHPGQSITLRIDAFPHQIYGTREAIVETVSAIALRPAELSIPLAVREPVFEVRARLRSREPGRDQQHWELVAGLSFHADVLQSKHRLYKWLLRHVLPAENGLNA